MFGPPVLGKIRQPYEVPTGKRSNTRCWVNWAEQVASGVEQLQPAIQPPFGCWMMSSKLQSDISEQVGGRQNVLRRFRTVRMLAFLKDPSPELWAKVDSQESVAEDCVYSHACGNGESKSRDDKSGCVNPDHGRITTRAENESHKLCTYGARCLCPGHGSPPVKCIFVHRDGTPRSCRNLDACVPACNCERPCF